MRNKIMIFIMILLLIIGIIDNANASTANQLMVSIIDGIVPLGAVSSFQPADAENLMGQVFTNGVPNPPTLLSAPAGVQPTLGTTLAIISSGKAAEIYEEFGAFQGTDFGGNPDFYRLEIKLVRSTTDTSAVSFDYRFMTSENPDNLDTVSRNDFFKVDICTVVGGCTEVLRNDVAGLLNPDVSTGTTPLSIVEGTQFSYSGPPIDDQQIALDGLVDPGEQFTLAFEISDEGGQFVNDIDSAVFLDDLKFVQVTVIPEFPTIALPIAAVIGLMLIFSKRRRDT